MIKLENITVSYQTKTSGTIFILNKISTIIPNGQWVSIVGPSGSGKTSLLKLIGGQQEPKNGTLTIDDHDLYKMPDHQKKEFQRNKISFIYQQFRLLPQFSVIENIMLPLLPYSKKHSIQQKAIQIIEKVGLSHRIHHLPHELSGGEQQRVAIARALLTEPEILLCDEPTGNLDFANRDNILSLLQAIHQEGQTIVLATHDEVVANKGQRIIEIENGNMTERVMSHD